MPNEKNKKIDGKNPLVKWGAIGGVLLAVGLFLAFGVDWDDVGRTNTNPLFTNIKPGY